MGDGPRKASRSHSKQHNRRTILQVVAEVGTTSRADVARATGLTRATVSSLVGELIHDDLITEVGTGESAGGKPPTLIQVNSDGRDLIVVDLSTHPFTGTIVDLSGNSRFSPISAPNTGDHEADLMALLDTLLATSTNTTLAIGIASPGVIGDNGVVVESANLGWQHFPLGAKVADATGHRVEVINDSHATAVAVLKRLQSELDEPVNDLLLVRVAEGVGGGIVLDGRLHLGSHRAAGELGHVVIEPEGTPCRCGNVGCLETVASAAAIHTAASGDSPERSDWTWSELVAAAGPKQAEAAAEGAGRAIGQAIAYLINVLDISHVVIASSAAGLGEQLVPPAKHVLNTRVLRSLAHDLSIVAVDDEGLALRGVADRILRQEFGATT